MLVSLSWLKKYVRIPVDTKTLVEDLTMAGLNVERVERRGLSIENLVVGKVLEKAKHPNADRLSWCRVQVGPNDVRDVVCGAPNVEAGQYVPVALPGAVLPNGMTIKRTKIRGVTSDGMICSETELGIGEDASGIIVLDGEYEVGTPAADALGGSDEILEVEVTPNRGDLLSHLGIAREVGAIYKVAVEWPSSSAAPPGKPDFEIAIESASDCPRYVGKRVRGARVGPSPAWLVKSLEAVGLQSVNNVVDVTNYVMMEMGQPLHAFDFGKLAGRRIVVRRAKPGEKLAALDGRTYDLSGEILVIADEEQPVAVAGVIGGEPTAVHADTTEILIESANFDPVVVRRGRKRLGLSTEASYRFERGVDRELCLRAAERAAELMCRVAGGEAGPAADRYLLPLEPPTVTVREARTRRILGASLSAEDIAGYLERLGFTIRKRGEESVAVGVPSHRADVREEIDLIEEVARLHGYDRIGVGQAFRCTTYARPDDFDRFLDSVGDYLCARGFTEVIASAFTDGRELEDFGWKNEDPRSRPVPLRNPLNANHRYLRTSLLPGMLDIVRRNLDYGTKRMKLYQTGSVFIAPEGTARLPLEQTVLTLVMTEPDGHDFWRQLKSGLDLFDMKEEIEALLRTFRVDLGTGVVYTFDRRTGAFSYAVHDGVAVEGGVVGDSVARRYGFEQPVWHATFDMKICYEARGRQAKARALPEYPSSRRDLSLVVPEGVEYAAMEKALARHGGPLLESVTVFDVYRGEKIAKGHTAYGLRLSFRAPDRTLRDEEIDRVIARLLAKLKSDLGVELRS